jgi:hypothetical protein
MDGMSVTEAKSMALYDLLARHWDLGAPVEQLAFDAGDGALAFALADGRAAIAAVADTEPPQARFRVAADTGRATLSRRHHAVPPIPQRMLDDAPLRIAAAGASGFLAGGRSGQIIRVMKGSVTEPFALGRGPLEAMISMPNAAVLVASEGLLTAYETQGGAASARPVLRYEGLAYRVCGRARRTQHRNLGCPWPFGSFKRGRGAVSSDPRRRCAFGIVVEPRRTLAFGWLG